MRKLIVALVAAGVTLAGITVVSAAAPKTPVTCTLESNTLTCPLPAPATVTKTVTRTKTVTATAAPSSSAPSSSTDPTTSAPPASDTSAPSSTDAPTPTSTSTSTSPSPAGFPDATNTGVPAGTQLTPYTGPCTITVPNTVIDSKTINCDLAVRTNGVLVTNSKLNGIIETPYDSTGFGFTVEDSEIDAGSRPVTAIGEVNFTVKRSHIYGGNRSAHCYNTCLMEDNYTHGQWVSQTTRTHASGTRMGQNGVFKHNTFLCDAQDNSVGSGCSADFTGYGDFTPVQNNLIENNLFKETTGGVCVYGGSSGGKPYSNQTNNIRFVGNTFE